MNCAAHSNVAAVAYCRTCGKPLCGNCTRSVHGVIYCESCLAARLEGVQPPQPPYSQVVDAPAGVVRAPGENSGPNPTVAGILAGFFPIGVGAVYNGQYAKGLAHLGIVALIIVGLNSDMPAYMNVFLGILLGFFYFYQIIDAVRSAIAIQMGQPAPDPFGIDQTFGSGGKAAEARANTEKLPTAAVVLIILGLLFLLNTTLDLHLHRIWPLFLIGIGVWLFVKRFGMEGVNLRQCSSQGLMGPAVLVTLGSLFMLESLDGPGFGRTWPVLLLVIGLIKLLGGNASRTSHDQTPAPPNAPPGDQGTVPPPPSNEVNHV
ncbi:MAG: B-box zinc finger protein [Acidobacteria bacterium]|nr:B-box zinc finger protein [Acidobacteriota bacterium]